MRVAIIGTGISGVSLASMLQDQHADCSVTLFDKSRGLGGRMSTRYTPSNEFDHGASFFTARSESFRAFLQPWIESGVVAAWQPKITTLALGEKPYKRDWFETHYVAQPRMTALCKAIAGHIDTCLGDRVAGLEKKHSHWVVTTEAGHQFDFDWVISTAPADQTAALMPIDLSAVVYDPLFVLMLGLDRSLPFDAAVVKHPMIDWIADTATKPGRHCRPSIVVHSTASWACQHVDSEEIQVKAAMLNAFQELTSAQGRDVQLHRWRYGRVSEPYIQPCWIDRELKLAACGDWCLGPRVEDAFNSAWQLANELKTEIEIF